MRNQKGEVSEEAARLLPNRRKVERASVAARSKESIRSLRKSGSVNRRNQISKECRRSAAVRMLPRSRHLVFPLECNMIGRNRYRQRGKTEDARVWTVNDATGAAFHKHKSSNRRKDEEGAKQIEENVSDAASRKCMEWIVASSSPVP
jgi:hypothetical protein